MSNSIMKDGEESIPTKTAIARWANIAFKAEQEVDRLRAEIAELDKHVLGWGDRYAELSNEADRLRAENAELKNRLTEEMAAHEHVCKIVGFRLPDHAKTAIRAEDPNAAPEC